MMLEELEWQSHRLILIIFLQLSKQPKKIKVHIKVLTAVQAGRN